ncbi:hypothetical protein [Streptomyces sp. NPDC005423]|uniref:hypothetical protein n=1 Tax=Streptomyces sp. NPDC005423 TaxID=3155343 RepID=UPI0033AB0133
MTTFALIGAGPGLGLAAASRFGAAGHRVALISRSARHLDNLAAELASQNIHAAQLIIPGAIRPDAEHSSPQALAERLYAIHTERGGFRHYAEPMPA